MQRELVQVACAAHFVLGAVPSALPYPSAPLHQGQPVHRGPVFTSDAALLKTTTARVCP